MKEAFLSRAWMLRLALGFQVLDALLLGADISLGLGSEPESEAGRAEATGILLTNIEAIKSSLQDRYCAGPRQKDRCVAKLCFQRTHSYVSYHGLLGIKTQEGWAEIALESCNQHEMDSVPFRG